MGSKGKRQRNCWYRSKKDMFETGKRLGLLTDKEYIRMTTWIHLKEINEEQVPCQEYFTVIWMKPIERMMTTTRQSKYGSISIFRTCFFLKMMFHHWLMFLKFRDVRWNHYGLDPFFLPIHYQILRVMPCSSLLVLNRSSLSPRHVWDNGRWASWWDDANHVKESSSK